MKCSVHPCLAIQLLTIQIHLQNILMLKEFKDRGTLTLLPRLYQDYLRSM